MNLKILNSLPSFALSFSLNLILNKPKDKNHILQVIKSAFLDHLQEQHIMESMSTSSNSRTKVDVMRPVLLKAGIPLAITVAGFVFARITTRKGSNVKASSAENQESSRQRDDNDINVQSLDSSSLSCLEAGHSSIETFQQKHEEELQNQQQTCELELETLVLRSQIKDLFIRESALETQYLRYQDMKEQELLLLELQNKLLLEITRIELLDKEISSVEANRHIFENMVAEYLKILELLEISRSRNRLLRSRVKKLFRKTKEQSRVIKQQCIQVKAKKAQVSRNHQELEAKATIIRKSEDDIEELKKAFGQLEMEKNELLRQVELANKEASSKIDVEEAKLVDYGQVASKLEQLEKENTAVIKELIYLRWSTACLRHESMRKNQEQQDREQSNNQIELNFEEIPGFGSDNEHDSPNLDHGDSCLHFPITGHTRAHPRRQKLIEKFKRWLECSDKTKEKINGKEKHKVKLLDRHSLSNGPGDQHDSARKSYSSA